MIERKLSIRTKSLNNLRHLFKNFLGEKFLIALLANRFTYSIAYRLTPNHYQYKTNSIRRCVRDSINWVLDLSDYMEHLYYFGLKAEPRESLYNLVEDGMVICDVGANFGETALQMSKLNPNGKVYALEPLPEAFQKLEKNTSLNKFNSCHPLNIALSNKDEKLTLQMTGVQNSGSTFVKPISCEGEPKIDATTLDHIIEKGGNCNLIKIDVEGFEKKVLQGAKKTLQAYRPV